MKSREIGTCYNSRMANTKTTGAAMGRVGDNLYRRGKHGIHYARINCNGKDRWKSLKTSNRAVAKAELIKLGKKLQDAPLPSGAGKAPTLAIS